MSLTSNDVHKIAHLARIAVNNSPDDTEQDEISTWLAQLNNILGLIEQMQATETNDIEPMAHAHNLKLRLREDCITETDHREEFQAIAPEVEAGLYLVPKVIE
ncbi:MAG TPA: Asp-tRNA(Asn)/Glu-tRNA(Gln) amidotransferase subunit GatC [Burkholderiales bacterium]|nr:Asp-tRNA(Asn)/Glu-tRNA(Gln) amidotransferase subunit GatC [Burkholderiales bacterium]